VLADRIDAMSPADRLGLAGPFASKGEGRRPEKVSYHLADCLIMRSGGFNGFEYDNGRTVDERCAIFLTGRIRWLARNPNAR